MKNEKNIRKVVHVLRTHLARLPSSKKFLFLFPLKINLMCSYFNSYKIESIICPKREGYLKHNKTKNKSKTNKKSTFTTWVHNSVSVSLFQTLSFLSHKPLLNTPLLDIVSCFLYKPLGIYIYILWREPTTLFKYFIAISEGNPEFN